MMLGQTRIEFIFGILVFMLLIFFIVNQINNVFSNNISNYEIDDLKAKAVNVIKFLVETGDIEKKYRAPVPVDVILVNDISGSMDGSTASSFGVNCRLSCDTFGSHDCACGTGCPDRCNDCDDDGYYADEGESPCSVNDAKSASKSFLNNLNPFYDNASLVVFNDSTYLYQALTNNFDLVRIAIDRMRGRGRTAIGEGLTIAKNELLNHGRADAKRIEILLTDGMNNTGRPVEGVAQEAAIDDITIFTIGLGESDYFDENLLMYVASVTGGKYYNAPTSGQLKQVYDDIAYEIKTEKLYVGMVVNRSYEISKEKVNDLKENCERLDIFELGTYRLRIYNSTSLMLICGTESLRPPRVFVNKRVLVNNDLGNITMEVW